MGCVWRSLGSRAATYVFYCLIQHCVKVNTTVAMGAGQQQLLQQDTDWDVDRPLWPFALPAVAPGLSPDRYLGSFPMHVNAHRYALFPLSVYSHMLIPINLLLIGPGRREGSGRVCVGLGGHWRWVKHSHTQPESPVWQIAPGLDSFLHWADVVSHLFSLVIIPH